MQQSRKILTLGPRPPQPDHGDPATLIASAVSSTRCVTGHYNNGTITLAPHVLYTKHGDPFVDAIVIERDGKPPKEPKLATFKLAGLRKLALEARAFLPQLRFDPADPKYAERILAVVRL